MNMMMFELAVAASALSPRNCPTHIELTELDSVWRMFDASVGSAKRISVFAIGPPVRSNCPMPRAVCRGGIGPDAGSAAAATGTTRSEEHKSELQSLMRISYAVFCLNKQKN